MSVAPAVTAALFEKLLFRARSGSVCDDTDHERDGGAMVDVLRVGLPASVDSSTWELLKILSKIQI